MAKKVKDESKVIGIVYFCDMLKKEMVCKDLTNLTASESECDLCDSHGSIDFFVNCECGQYHSIEIQSW